MPKYRVKADAPVIVHGRKDVRVTYQPGDVIELSEEEARKIAGNLEMPQEKQAAEPPPLDDPKEEARESKKKTK